MTDWSAYEAAYKRLVETTKALQRTTALMTMSMPDHPAQPLIRVMCKLELIKDWPIW